VKHSEIPHSFQVKDYDTLKAIADPLRAQIVELLIHDPLTVGQVGQRLGLAPSKLYYHFGLLERIGLITVVETRMVANIAEKIYRATGSHIDIEPKLLNFHTDEGKETINTLMISTLDTTRDDILRSLQARYAMLDEGSQRHPRAVNVSRMLSRMSDDQTQEFNRRIIELMNEFDAADAGPAAPGALAPVTFALTVAFYPSFYFREDGDGPPPGAAAAHGET
jgi:DNA-binding transcriptional ArsR family regulator